MAANPQLHNICRNLNEEQILDLTLYLAEFKKELIAEFLKDLEFINTIRKQDQVFDRIDVIINKYKKNLK